MKLMLMLKSTFFILFLGITLTVFGQNDPDATLILDGLSAKYDAFESVEMSFDITMQIPENDAIRQKGTLQKKGKAYKLDMEDKAVYCDGDALWLHLVDQKEVQINNADDNDEDVLSPNNLLSIHKSKRFTYRMHFEGMKQGKYLQEIEFKPNQEDEEFSKVRITIDKKTNEFKKAQVFFKDGSRYILDILSTTPNKDFSTDHFKFDKASNPDVYVEDLRI
jgi:outer membrane lipoprotein-sorting protein